MPRYIDTDYLDELITQLNSKGYGITRGEYKMIDNILSEFPTADAVEIVRCKDCESHDWCAIEDEARDESFFCKWGKRRTT